MLGHPWSLLTDIDFDMDFFFVMQAQDYSLAFTPTELMKGLEI